MRASRAIRRGFRASFAGESTPIWQKRWTWAYGAELIATNEALGREPRLSLSEAFFIGGLIGQLGYDRSNSLLEPDQGLPPPGRVNPEVSLQDGRLPIFETCSKAAPIIPWVKAW
jgi:translocation and assembly module TamA